uniref:Uncharacterized protein n=1 Tax=viral metagenome TaxID=1070528 RepID=A0A6C0DFQ1_9ZZZZ
MNINNGIYCFSTVKIKIQEGVQVNIQVNKNYKYYSILFFSLDTKERNNILL